MQVRTSIEADRVIAPSFGDSDAGASSRDDQVQLRTDAQALVWDQLILVKSLLNLFLRRWITTLTNFSMISLLTCLPISLLIGRISGLQCACHHSSWL